MSELTRPNHKAVTRPANNLPTTKHDRHAVRTKNNRTPAYRAFPMTPPTAPQGQVADARYVGHRTEYRIQKVLASDVKQVLILAAVMFGAAAIVGLVFFFLVVL